MEVLSAGEAVPQVEPIPQAEPIPQVEPVLQVDPIPEIPIPTQNTVIPPPILIPTKSGVNTALFSTTEDVVISGGGE